MGSSASAPQKDIYNVTVKDIMKFNNRNVVTVREKDNLMDAIKALHANNILSAPIVDENGYCKRGIFALDDVIMHVSRICKQTVKPTKGVPSKHLKTDTLDDLVLRHRILHNETLLDIVGRHRGDSKFLAVSKNDKVSDALILYGVGVQRICVASRRKVIGILSQSTLLKWIAEDTRRLGDLENETADQLGILWPRVVKISKDALVIDAVELMHDKGVFSLPIIDEEGCLFGHISMSDLKTLLLEEGNFSDLLLPLKEFSKKRSNDRGLVTAKTSSRMKDIVKRLVEEHVHQLYLLDDNNKPHSFISMTNVCHKLFRTYSLVSPGSKRYPVHPRSSASNAAMPESPRASLLPVREYIVT